MTVVYLTVWVCWAFSVTTRVIILSLDSLPVDDIYFKWRQTILIQLPVAAETLRTEVDECYTKAHSNTVLFIWTIKLRFPDIFWAHVTNNMTWVGRISCQGQSKEQFLYQYFCFLFQAVMYESEVWQYSKIYLDINLSFFMMSGTSEFLWLFTFDSVLKTALCFLQWLPTVPIQCVCVCVSHEGYFFAD